MLITDYLANVFNIKQYAQLMKIVEKYLSKEEFESIAFRGTSGCAVAFPLALSMKKELLHVRKSGGHSSMSIEGQTKIKTYAIVDDFVETGATLQTIKETIVKWYSQSCKQEPTCTAIFLYTEDDAQYALSKIDSLFPHATFYALRNDGHNYTLRIYPASNRRNYTIKNIFFDNGEIG